MLECPRRVAQPAKASIKHWLLEAKRVVLEPTIEMMFRSATADSKLPEVLLSELESAVLSF